MSNILDVCSDLRFAVNDAMSVDFIGKGNIWINNTYEESVYDLTKYIIAEALKKTAEDNGRKQGQKHQSGLSKQTYL